MKVKLCPSCGKRNPSHRWRCVECNSSITSVRDIEFSEENSTLEDEEIKSSKLEDNSTFEEMVRKGFEWDSEEQFFTSYQRSLVGKRDAWVWLFGVIGPLLLTSAAWVDYYKISQLLSTTQVKPHAVYCQHEMQEDC